MAVLGPSGCGKSTTLADARRHLPAERAATSLFDGARVNDVEARGRNVGIVFQSYALYPEHDGAREHRCSRCASRASNGRGRAPRARDRRARARRRAARPAAGQLSGGQQQRVALARALVKRAASAAARRAAVEPRCRAAAHDAHRDPPHPARARRHHDPGHPRPDRGHDDGRPRRRHERRPRRAGGHGRRSLRASRRPCSSPSFIGSPPINLFDGDADGGVLKVHEARIPLAESVQRPGRPGHSAREPARRRRAATPARVTAVEPMGREVLYTADSAFGRHSLSRGRRGTLAIAKATTCRSVSLPRARSCSTRRAAAGSMCGIAA